MPRGLALITKLDGLSEEFAEGVESKGWNKQTEFFAKKEHRFEDMCPIPDSACKRRSSRVAEFLALRLGIELNVGDSAPQPNIKTRTSVTIPYSTFLWRSNTPEVAQ